MVNKKVGLTAAVLLATSQLTFAADDLQINGFINVTGGTVDSSKLAESETAAGYDNGVSFDQGTLVGLQLAQKVNDKTTATLQLISRGSQGFETEAAWAYITYDINDDIRVRAGRLRTPFFQYSDFLEVGYAYNWITPPRIVYRLDTMSSVTGADITYSFTAGPIDGSFQLYGGRYHDDFTLDGDTYDMELRKAGGAAFNLNSGNFSGRISYHQADFYINDLGGQGQRKLDGLADMASLLGVDVVPSGQVSQFYQASLAWDNGSTALVGEYTALRHDSHLLVNDNAWFVSAAQRLGDFTLHLTYAQADDSLKSGDIGIAQKFVQAKDSSTTLGLRYDFDTNTALKLEATYIEMQDASERLAELAAHPGTPDKGEIFSATNRDLVKSTGMLYTVGLSVMF